MKLRGLLAATLVAMSGPTFAIDGEWEGFNYSLKSTVTAGLAIRAEERDLNQIAKLAVPGQGNLCTSGVGTSNNGCTTVAGNQALNKSRGAYSGVNADAGDLNYNQGDITDSIISYTPEFKLQRGDIKVEFSGLFYYDPVNANFTEFHADNFYQPTYTKRADNVVNAYARGGELRKAFIQINQEVLGQSFTFRIGRQILPWGESLLVLFNNLNQLNPVDANAAARPGFQLGNLSTPVNMAVLSFPVQDNLSVELVAPLEWRPVRAPPHGSFASTSNVIDNNYAILGLGYSHDDPNGIAPPYTNNSLISKSSNRVSVLSPDYGRASNLGQYGARMTYIADWLNNTEVSLHYLHYHSQFPYLSGFAANKSCLRDSLTLTDAATSCKGFSAAPGGTDPLTVSSTKLFLEYPENIDLFGVSFNTKAMGLALSGEYAYRPNMPLQIQTTDVIFALLQPSLPRTDLTAGPSVVVPSATHGIPSYLTAYRGIDVQGNQLIHGFERFHVHNVSLSALKLIPHNPFGADDMTAILELGATYVDNMTDFHVLPLNGSGDNTHPSAGADGTGNGKLGSAPDTSRLNPTTQTTNIPTKLSYGYRTVVKLAYNKLVPGVVLEPTLIFFHDVGGITPSPQTNFIEGRKVVNLGVVMRFPNELLIGTAYEAKFGSNAAEYLERDRDRVLAYGSYSF